jgi:hypothetical protein
MNNICFYTVFFAGASKGMVSTCGESVSIRYKFDRLIKVTY